MSQEGLVSIGRLSKTHGNEGYITLVLSDYAQDLFFEPNLLWLITSKSGNRPVPFYVTNTQRISDQKVRLQFEDYCSVDLAAPLQGATVLMEVTVEQLAEIKTENKDFIDYSVIHAGNNLGQVNEVFDFSGNIVFNVLGANTEIMIPADESLIVRIDHEHKEIHMNLPDGLLDEEEHESV